MAKIKVLRPFVFSTPAKQGSNGPGDEKMFTVGEHEVSDDFLAHPWIRDTYAEGKIEAPHQTRARVEKELADAQQAVAESQAATAAAEASFARLKAAEPGVTASAEEIQEELNTPVNILKVRPRPGITTPVNKQRA